MSKEDQNTDLTELRTLLATLKASRSRVSGAREDKEVAGLTPQGDDRGGIELVYYHMERMLTRMIAHLEFLFSTRNEGSLIDIAAVKADTLKILSEAERLALGQSPGTDGALHQDDS